MARTLSQEQRIASRTLSTYVRAGFGVVVLVAVALVWSLIAALHDLRNAQDDRPDHPLFERNLASIESRFDGLPDSHVTYEAREVLTNGADVYVGNAARSIGAFQARFHPSLVPHTRNYIEALIDEVSSRGLRISFTPSPSSIRTEYLGDGYYGVRFVGHELRHQGRQRVSGETDMLMGAPTGDVFDAVAVDVYLRRDEPSPMSPLGLYVIGFEYPDWISLYEEYPDHLDEYRQKINQFESMF